MGTTPVPGVTLPTQAETVALVPMHMHMRMTVLHTLMPMVSGVRCNSDRGTVTTYEAAAGNRILQRVWGAVTLRRLAQAGLK